MAVAPEEVTTCPECEGDGKCTMCEGTGDYVEGSRSDTPVVDDCPECGGDGDCTGCDGGGYT